MDEQEIPWSDDGVAHIFQCEEITDGDICDHTKIAYAAGRCMEKVYERLKRDGIPVAWLGEQRIRLPRESVTNKAFLYFDVQIKRPPEESR